MCAADVNSGINTRAGLKAHDLVLAALMVHAYGDGKWRYPQTAPAAFTPHAGARSPRCAQLGRCNGATVDGQVLRCAGRCARTAAAACSAVCARVCCALLCCALVCTCVARSAHAQQNLRDDPARDSDPLLGA